jgi:uncharacterized protein (TIGR02217 family)
MAFWLAKSRKGQASSYIQRFDPRFWTVNFPRPMMASATVPSPDTLQVDCEFLNKGDLAGLIWESEDTLDHPLLAYETSFDYSRTTLSFRWQSSGLMPLDQPNGPTLTIEGRDASGADKTWYVRLWNYADGTPSDAQIDLPFSDLTGGWTATEDPVHPSDIDRMFISLVHPDYEAGSGEAFPTFQTGRVTLSGIRCVGHNAMLEIGDVLLPAHGERIATGYDDAYNQTPDRLVRNIIGLGYRDELIHYVGMSHYMRLERVGSWRARIVRPAKFCEPCVQWHQSLFALCKSSELEIIASVSYEVFDDYAITAWRQIAYDGEPALTGWEPPSTLLSPGRSQAMIWLRQVAVEFVTLLEHANLPVRFQIGEPWWWVTPDGKPCLYDPETLSGVGGTPPVIADMREALDQAQLNFLDQVGQLLAQSTLDLADAVRDAATGPAEILLLAFTPTILHQEMPELRRANLPAGWAYPAFDRLQLEDYDWLTDGADALRRAAYAAADDFLGYPIELQDYLSGFVLDADDAEEYWQRIDAGLDEAAARGVTRRFVWALPQVTRDGYTRLPGKKEDEVRAFDDIHYPLPLGRSSAVSPEFSTSVAVTSSGHERRNSLWSDARMHFDVGPGIRSEDELGELISFFRARRGAARGFLVTDPFDFSSHDMTKQPSNADMLIGIGDGLKADFQLVKNYGDEDDDAQQRVITRPREGSIVVSVDGQNSTEWTLGEQGLITFSNAPASGAEVRAGFLFDVPVRFADDRLDISGINFAAGEAPSVALIEIREAQ